MKAWLALMCVGHLWYQLQLVEQPSNLLCHVGPPPGPCVWVCVCVCVCARALYLVTFSRVCIVGVLQATF